MSWKQQLPITDNLEKTSIGDKRKKNHMLSGNRLCAIIHILLLLKIRSVKSNFPNLCARFP